MAEGAETRIQFQVLGPVQAIRDDEVLRIGGVKAKGVLALLVLEAGRVVPTSRLVDGVWGEDPSEGVIPALQVHISNLRKVLGAEVLQTRAPGYRLDGARSEVDASQFERELERARALRAHGDLGEAERLLVSALSRFTGCPLADVLDLPFAQAASTWLTELRALGTEELVDVLLDRGRPRDAVPLIEVAIAEAPGRERLWGQLMVALYRTDRQADALKAYQRAREALVEVGVEPGPNLRDLEAAVLAQDARLLGVSSAAGGEVPPTFRVQPAARAWLVADGGREVALDAMVTIGRSPQCEVTLDDMAVSRRHCEVRPALGGHLLIDLKSTNGTTVNGSQVSEHLLVDGDEIRIGGHTILYRCG